MGAKADDRSRIHINPAWAAFCAALLMAILCLLLYQWDNKHTAPGAQPINGILYLTQEELSSTPAHYLIRDWAYYPDVLLTPEALEREGQTLYHRYISIGQYGGMELDQTSAAPWGCGTYRLVLSLPETEATYSLKLPVIYSAYSLYINDELMLQMGQTDPEYFLDALQERVVTFRGGGYVQILLAVSDQNGFYSGMIHPPALGLPQTITRLEYIRYILFTATELLACVLLVLSVYLTFSSHSGIVGWMIPLCLFLIVYLAYPLTQVFLRLPNYPWRILVTLSLYGFYTVLIWVYSTRYRWKDFWSLLMKVVSLFVLVVGMTIALMPILSTQARHLYALSVQSSLLHWVLAANTVLLTWRTSREEGHYSWQLSAGAAVLCVSMGASLLLPLYDPILGGWFPEIGMVVFLVILILVQLNDVAAAYHFRLTYNERVRQTERLLALEQANYAGLQTRIAEARQLRHDLRQHLRVIRTLLSQGEYQEAEHYLEEYDKAEGEALTRPFQFCQAQEADAILAYYWNRAQALNARFEFTGQIPVLSGHMSVDLCTLLGNLLENALEAIEKQEDGARFLRITAQAPQGKLLFQVVNSCSARAVTEDNRFRSSKRDELGIGTLSVQMIAQRYGGFASFTSTDDSFTARVVLSVPALSANSN